MLAGAVGVVAVGVLGLPLLLAPTRLPADPITVAPAVAGTGTPLRPSAPYSRGVSLPQVMSVFLKLILNILEEQDFDGGSRLVRLSLCALDDDETHLVYVDYVELLLLPRLSLAPLPLARPLLEYFRVFAFRHYTFLHPNLIAVLAS